jgi:hypothetical protein
MEPKGHPDDIQPDAYPTGVIWHCNRMAKQAKRPLMLIKQLLAHSLWVIRA